MSGTPEQVCTRKQPVDAQSALRAKPHWANGVAPYTEVIQHPAFGTEMSNSGVFRFSETGALIRQQNLPVFEELEFGSRNLVIRRNGQETERPIPEQLVLYLSTLQAIVMGTPEKIDPSYRQTLKQRPTGWAVYLTLLKPLAKQMTKRRKGELVLTGCGSVLYSIQIGAKRGQQRQIRFYVE